MSKRLSQSLGLPRWVLLPIAFAGLLLFITMMGLPVYSSTKATWPSLSVWIAVFLAVVVPILLILAIGVGCALYQVHGPNPKNPWVRALFKGVEWGILLVAVTVYVVQLLR